MKVVTPHLPMPPEVERELREKRDGPAPHLTKLADGMARERELVTMLNDANKALLLVREVTENVERWVNNYGPIPGPALVEQSDLDHPLRRLYFSAYAIMMEVAHLYGRGLYIPSLPPPSPCIHGEVVDISETRQ